MLTTLFDRGHRLLVALTAVAAMSVLCRTSYAAPGYPGMLTQSDEVSVSFSDTPLSEALKELQAQTTFTFVYNNSIVNARSRVNATADHESLASVLGKILSPLDLTWTVMDSQVVIYPDSGQERKPVTITGTVKDSNGDPVIGAGVSLKGTGTGVITDTKGNFSMTTVEGSVLVVSSLGYETQEVTVGKSAKLFVTLEEDYQQLDDVVVIGYGQQKKVNLTGSVAVREMTEMENQPLTNASHALYAMPGLYINTASRKAGSDAATIRIRGVGTLSSSSPMILVDGMEYSLDEINPHDIESITVLKDASASIYGSKAANGVILVTTKQARVGAPVVKLSANVGVQYATRLPDVVTDPIQYMRMRNQAELNEGKLSVTYAEDDILEYQEGMKHDPYTYPASDWYDLCFRPGILQQYNANVSGGTEGINYSVSVGYQNQRGIMIANDDMERFSWDIKLNSQVTKRLKVGVGIVGNLRYNTEPIYGVSTTMNVINRALPIFGAELPDGKYLSSWLSTPGRNNIENPLMELKEGRIKRQYQRFLAKLNVQYDLPWGIKYNANLGYVKADHWSKNFKHAMYTYNPKTMEKHPFSAYVSVKDWDNNIINYTFYNTLSWGKSFNEKHNLNVMIGSEYKRYDSKNFQAGKRDYFNNQLDALTPGSNMNEISGGQSLELLSSYFGRITYDYKEKYLLDITARYDGSSKFARGNRWAFFPAVSLGWRIDKEGFMKNVKQIDLLKLRASVGQMGNQAIGNYEYLMSVVASSSYNYSFDDILQGGGSDR